MEVELVRYVGAGLAAALSGLSSGLPRTWISDGLALVTKLSGERPPALMPIINSAVSEICRGWRGGNVPDPIALQQLEVLPVLLQEHGPSADKWARAFAELASGEPADRQHAQKLASIMASEIVSAASAAGTIQRSGLLVPVSMVLLNGLFEALLLNASHLKALVPYADRLVAGADSGEDADDTGGLADAIDRLAPSVCPEALLAALIAAERARGLTDREIEPILENKAIACRDLLRQLKSQIRATGDDVLRDRLQAFRTQLEAGELANAGETLAGAEDAWTARAGVGEPEAAYVATANLRQLRARLNELRGLWREAADDYALSCRYCTSLDVKGRWQLMMWQAAALSRHGILNDDLESLFDAAQIHAEAGGLLQEHDAPIEWATGNVDLGNLLLTLAVREGRPERYLAAALHFKPAIDVFSREGAMENWALAQLGFAHALKGQAEVQGDPVILADAAFAYRAALGMLHAGRSPSEWTAAQFGLGDSLVRIAEEAGETGLMDEAVAALKSALGNMRQPEAKHVEAALGRAYVVLAAEKEDVNVLNDAVEQLQRALEPSGSGLKDTDTALLLHLLGSSLWALGEAAGDCTRLQSALSTLGSARQRYSAAGSTSTAASISKEISNLEVALVRMRRSQRHFASIARVKS